MTDERERALRDEFDGKLAALRDELLEVAARAARPRCVSVERACEDYGFSRATFDRWLADPRCGLDAGPAPVVLRPNGPGGKVVVHVERLEAWLDARGRGTRVAPRRA